MSQPDILISDNFVQINKKSPFLFVNESGVLLDGSFSFSVNESGINGYLNYSLVGNFLERENGFIGGDVNNQNLKIYFTEEEFLAAHGIEKALVVSTTLEHFDEKLNEYAVARGLDYIKNLAQEEDPNLAIFNDMIEFVS